MSRQRWGYPPGFTLTEMLVVLLIFGFVAAGVYQVLVSSRTSYEQQKVTLEMQQNARVALESLADDFRHVSYGKDPTQPSIHYAGPDSVTFVADIMPAISGAEQVSYFLSPDGDLDTPNPGDTVLMKTVSDSGGTLLFSEPQSYGIKVGGLSLRYFNGSGVELANPVPQPELIGEALIEVTAVEPRAHRYQGTYLEETLSTTIYPRNLPLTPARSRPSIPTVGTLSVPNCESVTVPWTTPTTNTDGTDLPLNEISHFTLYFGTDPDTMSLYCRVARTINQWTVSNLTGGNHYYFGITCTSRSGVESYPGPADIDLTVPLYPDIPTSFAWAPNPSGAGVRFDWDAVTTFEDATPITTPVDYRLYRASYAGVTADPAHRVAEIPVSIWYVDSTLTDCQDYYYIVTAIACGNEGSPSAEQHVTVPAVPACVGLIELALTEFNGEVRVSWSAPTARTDGSVLAPEEIDGYRIYYDSEPYTSWQSLDTAADPTSAILTGLDDCETYYVNVVARDGCLHLGDRCVYNETSIQTAEPCNPEPPATPTLLHALASADRIDLAWPVNDTDCDLLGYRVYYGHASGGPYNGTEALEGTSPLFLSSAQALAGDSCRVTLTGLNPCQDYAFVVCAVDNCAPANLSPASPEALAQTSCLSCGLEAGCATYLATGAGYGDVRLELYPEDGLAASLEELTPDWSGPAQITQVWAGRPLTLVWDAAGAAGLDGPVGPRPSATPLHLDPFTVPASAEIYDGLPVMLRFDGDQRLQSLGLSFWSNGGLCGADPRSIASGLHFEDFDDGYPGDWHVHAGTWQVVGGELYQSAGSSIALITQVGDYTDCTLETKLKITYGSNPYLIFRYQDTSNYYTFGIKTSTNEARLARYQNGSFYVTSSTYYPCTTNRWYMLRVEVSGSTIRGYVNCAEVLEVTDTSMKSHGRIGLRTYSARVYYDDVRVGGSETLP